VDNIKIVEKKRILGGFDLDSCVSLEGVADGPSSSFVGVSSEYFVKSQ
jgi:hypothetical protein